MPRVSTKTGSIGLRVHIITQTTCPHKHSLRVELEEAEIAQWYLSVQTTLFMGTRKISPNAMCPHTQRPSFARRQADIRPTVPSVQTTLSTGTRRNSSYGSFLYRPRFQQGQDEIHPMVPFCIDHAFNRDKTKFILWFLSVQTTLSTGTRRNSLHGVCLYILRFQKEQDEIRPTVSVCIDHSFNRDRTKFVLWCLSVQTTLSTGTRRNSPCGVCIEHSFRHGQDEIRPVMSVQSKLSTWTRQNSPDGVCLYRPRFQRRQGERRLIVPVYKLRPRSESRHGSKEKFNR